MRFCRAWSVTTYFRIVGAFLFSCVLGSAVARADVLLVTNGGGDSVFAYETSPATSLGAFVTAGSGGLNDPRGIAFGPDGNLYVVGNTPGIINSYDAQTGAFLGTFATMPAGVGAFGLTFGPGGDAYVTFIISNSVARFDGSTGVSEGTFVLGGSGGLAAPRDLVFGPDGNLYVSSADSDQVLRYDGTTGAFIDVFADDVDARGLVFGPDGNLYVADFDAHRVLEFDGTTGDLIGVFASGGGLLGPVGILFGPDGELYVAGFTSSNILRYDGSTGAFIDTMASGAGLINPRLMVFQVPEPTTLVLIMVGLAGLGFARRRTQG